jgi:hypothetical protein
MALNAIGKVEPYVPRGEAFYCARENRATSMNEPPKSSISVKLNINTADAICPAYKIAQ